MKARLLIGFVILLLVGLVAWFRLQPKRSDPTAMSAPSVPGIHALFENKRLQFQSGKISYSLYRGRLPEREAKEAIEILLKALDQTDESAGRRVARLKEDWLAGGKVAFAARGSRLFSPAGFLCEEGKPAAMFDQRVRERAKIDDGMLWFKASYCGGTYSTLDPITRKLDVSSVSSPVGLGPISMADFDVTIADTKGLVTDIPGRKIVVEATRSGYTMTFTMPGPGYERQIYALDGQIPYLRRIEGRLGKRGTIIADRFYVGYDDIQASEAAKPKIRFPRYIVELVQQESGEFTTKIIAVDAVESRHVADEELIIAIDENIAITTR